MTRSDKENGTDKRVDGRAEGSPVVRVREEKGRPPRHSGADDVAHDRGQRAKDETDAGQPEMDAIRPRRDTTAPGDTGTAPDDITVAMPEDYGDDWK